MAQDATIVTNKKPTFNLGTFARETRREMAKVTWPSRKETVTTTIMIVVMAIITGLVFFGIDTVLGFVISRILGMNS